MNSEFKSGITLTLLIFLVSTFVISAYTLNRQSQADGQLYDFVIPKQGNLIDDATCYAWIPNDVGPIRTIIVHLHGCTREGDAEQMMHDVQWRQLAKKWHSALVAPKFISGGNAKNCINWYNPDNGSEPVFLEMLNRLADKTDHPEVKSVPWTLWGHSGGSLWITAMAGKYPGRVAVAVAEACGVDISPIAAARKVPMLHHNGIKDICYNNAEIVANGRKSGALWAHAVNPVVESAMDGHQVHDLRFLAIPWIDACLKMRLPIRAGDSTLRDIPAKNGWLGDTATKAIAPVKHYIGNQFASNWFPTRTLAEKWAEYMVSGTVTDHTPPPAPFNLRTTSLKNQIVLYWNAFPDLESGIKTFIIYRNGKYLQKLQYRTKTKYSKQTGYQRWNDGDQPAPIPAPEMTFRDTSIKAGGTYRYQVSNVNWSDVESMKSKAVRAIADR
ncbi:PHB depolymerase family esterase [Mucilaginibacter sp. PAMB04168]|uniref:PHB depolymerase family esterase n=1 Tax=Mucilaginibacter sp. PAMB04168 TaxID=3138567 RepID=UPI0031F62AFE